MAPEQVDFNMPKNKKKKKERKKNENKKQKKKKKESRHRPHIFHKNLLKITTDVNV